MSRMTRDAITIGPMDVPLSVQQRAFVGRLIAEALDRSLPYEELRKDGRYTLTIHLTPVSAPEPTAQDALTNG